MGKIRLIILFAFASLSVKAELKQCAGVQLKQPVTFVLPAQAGASADLVARRLQLELQKQHNIRVIVENKPGGNGNIGAVYASTCVDTAGSCFFMAQSSEMTLNTQVPGAPYQLSSFHPTALIATQPHILVCNKSKVPKVDSVKDLVGMLKSYDRFFGIENGKKTVNQNRKGDDPHFFFADAGSSNFTGVMSLNFAGTIGVDYGQSGVISVPYRGTRDAFQSVLQGDSDCMFASAYMVKGLMTKGNAKNLVVLGNTGDRDLEIEGVKIPALKGIKDLESFGNHTNWIGLFASPKINKKVNECWNAMVDEIMFQPEFLKFLNQNGMLRPAELAVTPETFDSFVKSDFVSKKAFFKKTQKAPMIPGGTQ